MMRSKVLENEPLWFMIRASSASIISFKASCSDKAFSLMLCRAINRAERSLQHVQ